MGMFSSTASFLLLVVLAVQSQEVFFWCGSSYDDASTSCIQSCPLGYGCPDGLSCFAGVSCSTSTDNGSSSSITTSSPTSRSDSSTLTFITAPTTTTTAATILNTPTSPESIELSPSSSSNSNTLANSLDGLTGVAAVEATFLSMKDAIDNNLFLYETPAMEWEPSSVYRFDGFFSGMQVMHSEGVAGKTLYMGGDCAHCHMYGLINVAAFLAQAMKETIRYDACDENSWDRVGDEKKYAISNSCGQLGQSYQDYHCSDEEKHMECEVDPEMTITAVTNAKWWGAPGPLMCGPKSLYPQTGYWDYNYACDNPWATPPESCDEYEGQKGGKAINDVAYPNAAGRTDVEGCCWWGRGVIQTSGICNFGKLNYFLGKRAADEGRESRYPEVDFCKDPETICWSEEHSELKWIAGFFYWVQDVQDYDEGGWNYINELRTFVDGGMVDDAFINAVSGIVNRGCHNPPCGTGDLDGGPERAENFMKVIDEMRFAFIDVTEIITAPETLPPTPPTFLPHTSPSVSLPLSTPPSFPPYTSLSVSLPPSTPPSFPPYTSLSVSLPPSMPPLFPPYAALSVSLPPSTPPTSPPSTALSVSLPPSTTSSISIDNSRSPTTSSSPKLEFSTSMPSPEEAFSTPTPSSLDSTPSTPGSNILQPLDEKPGMEEPDETFLSNAEVVGPDEIRYTCGDGYQVDQSDTSIPLSVEVKFDYEIHNGIDVTVSDALRDIKMSIMQGIADVVQCDIAYSGRRLQNQFDNITGLWSNSFDLPDPDASSCIVDVETSNPTTCTPVSGGFTIYATSDTPKASLDETSKSLSELVQTSMDSGQYETAMIDKAFYIGDREKISKSPVLAEAMSIRTEEASKSNRGLMIAIYVLSSACILLICLVCITARTCREKTVDVRRERGPEMSFRSFMTQRDGSLRDPESQRGSGPYSWQQSKLLWQRDQPNRSNGPHQRSMPMQNRNNINTLRPQREVASSLPATTTRRFVDGQNWNQKLPGQDNEALWNRRLPVEDDEEQVYPMEKGVAPVTHQSRTVPTVLHMTSGDDISSSDSSDSSTDSSEGIEQMNDPAPPTRQTDEDLNANSQPFHLFDGNYDTPALNNSAKSLQSESSNAREERQERLARARARSAGRQSRRLS